MARYTDAVCRLCRRQGMKLFLKGDKCFTPKCPVERRAYAPGEHGQRRKKVSEYGTQLREKQKIKSIYGVLERQFRKSFEEAERRPGITGENLLQILEMRLDNVVYRMGWASSRPQARQLVRHGHFRLRGRKTDIPSAQVKPGDVISVHEGSRDDEYFQTVIPSMAKKTIPKWLSLDADGMSGRVLAVPTREEIDTAVSEQLVVEYYSR
ncbi:MAG: 30S ribosomal protein S4 [Sphingomonadaceae bacterium]